MITAKHHWLIYPLFQWLTGFLLRQNFSTIHFDGDGPQGEGAVLVVANHCSWWDGFWVQYLNNKRIHRTFHVMMLKEQLQKHWYFQYTGGFSVQKHSRDALASIHYTVELLNNNENMVAVFPQGEIHSLYDNQLHFQSGITHIVSACGNQTQVLLVVNLVDYFSDAKQHLYTYTIPFTAEQLKTKNIEEEYNRFYTEVLNKHKTKTS